MFHLGEIHSKAGQYMRAVPCFEQALNSIPLWVEARKSLAETLEKSGEPQKAAQQYELLFELSAHHADREWICAQAALALARIYSNECPPSETLKKHLDRDPQNEVLAYARASALETEGNSLEARSLFEKFTLSFEKDHLRANAWFRLARLSQPDRQRPFLAECLKLAPDHNGAQKLMRELNCNKQLV